MVELNDCPSYCKQCSDVLKANEESSTLEETEPNPGGGPRCLPGRHTGFFFIPVGVIAKDFIDMLSEKATEGASELKVDDIAASGTWNNSTSVVSPFPVKLKPPNPFIKAPCSTDHIEVLGWIGCIYWVLVREMLVGSLVVLQAFCNLNPSSADGNGPISQHVSTHSMLAPEEALTTLIPDTGTAEVIVLEEMSLDFSITDGLKTITSSSSSHSTYNCCFGKRSPTVNCPASGLSSSMPLNLVTSFKPLKRFLEKSRISCAGRRGTNPLSSKSSGNARRLPVSPSSYLLMLKKHVSSSSSSTNLDPVDISLLKKLIQFFQKKDLALACFSSDSLPSAIS
ncbi:hypothetical protein H5410_053977 [Solanum commersonii]|uniref:Uncharacterized protein n=1 Tax=Solanum commersonii TaxID=4109 RepID=A0A9J5X7W6_SOLCO|nr:hypothetical protein H5410_053977 [Solanum commersonii]